MSKLTKQNTRNIFAKQSFDPKCSPWAFGKRLGDRPICPGGIGGVGNSQNSEFYFRSKFVDFCSGNVLAFGPRHRFGSYLINVVIKNRQSTDARAALVNCQRLSPPCRRMRCIEIGLVDFRHTIARHEPHQLLEDVENSFQRGWRQVLFRFFYFLATLMSMICPMAS